MQTHQYKSGLKPFLQYKLLYVATNLLGVDEWLLMRTYRVFL
ncbi:hypothetical protein SPWS13_1015 [Shewanella putrefaciens]|nr:hypothetical protein SPWS13_1015 [Shewanella putrefaciens]